MQGIRNEKKKSQNANIWASNQEGAISKTIKTWQQNSFQNIKIIEVKQLNWDDMNGYIFSLAK